MGIKVLPETFADLPSRLSGTPGVRRDEGPGRRCVARLCYDPSQQTRNRFRLRRASPHADYELRAGQWRVFYRFDGEVVLVTLIGEKRGAVLIVEGEELKL